MNTHTDTPALSLSDRWKRYRYLEWVDTWLWTMPRRQRRAVLADLKQNLAVAAADEGMDAAIEELGRPRALAAEYLDGEPRRGPLWPHGALAAVIVGAVWVYATMIYVFGAVDALSAAAVGETVQIGFLGVDIVAEASSERLGATFTGFSWPAFVAVLLAFLVFSRTWRLGAGRN